MGAETLILYFYENMEKVRYFNKIADIFIIAKKGLPRQLKTPIAFSMFPILGTNLCLNDMLL
jgi:hypothetical protein